MITFLLVSILLPSVLGLFFLICEIVYLKSLSVQFPEKQYRIYINEEKIKDHEIN